MEIIKTKNTCGFQKVILMFASFAVFICFGYFDIWKTVVIKHIERHQQIVKFKSFALLFVDVTLGPVTYNDGEKEILVGAVSWGRLDCNGHSVFARVSEVVPWIQEQMRQPC